jgi:hypothetical protein
MRLTPGMRQALLRAANRNLKISEISAVAALARMAEGQV